MKISTYTIENKYLKITLLDLGATIYEFIVKEKNNRNIVLSSLHLESYLTKEGGFFGATVGRVAGRIGNGQFVLDGKVYNLDQNEKETNSLHGGFNSFAFAFFTLVAKSGDKVVFKYLSNDNEGGFPGQLTLVVEYSLLADSLLIKYSATTTKSTIINITNHSYFNLDGEGLVTEHTLQANVDSFYLHDEKQLNARKHQAVDSPFSLEHGKQLKTIIFDPLVNVPPPSGLDHLLVLKDGCLTFRGKDLTLEVQSNYPAVQLYSTNFPADTILKARRKPFQYEALAIEPVDIVRKQDEHPELLLKKGETYARTIRYSVTLR